MTSTSSLGGTAITVQFDLNRNIDAAANDIQAAINAAAGQLPKDLPSPPTYRKVNPSDTPILILSVQSDVAPVIDVDDAAENILAQHLSQISGVSLVRVGGQQTPAIRIQVDPAKLVEKGLQLEDVRAQIGIATVDTPKGAIIGPKQTFTIQANDQLTQAKGWNDVIVAYRNGAPVRVRDIGQAVAGPQDSTQAAWSNGKPSVFLVVFKIPGANVISTVETIKATLATLQASIPPTIHVSILSDRTNIIRASVRDVEFTLMITIALVVMVIFVFLRNLVATIIPSVTVPRALLGACALMWVASYSIDNLSLMAFTISVGFVVDDAIVMLENITRHVEEAKPLQAALKGSSEIGFTIISISVSLIAVLIPLLMMSGIIGRLFREFSVTIAMTIFVSAVVSLTLTPMMASRFLKSREEERHGRLYNLSEKGFVALANGYERGIDFVLRHRFATLLTFIGTVIATVYLFVVIPKGFFPQQDTGILYGTTESGRTFHFRSCIACSRKSGDWWLPAIQRRDHRPVAAGRERARGQAGLHLQPQRAADLPKRHASTSVDFWQPGGIYRDVRLRVVPQVFLADVFAKPVTSWTPRPGRSSSRSAWTPRSTATAWTPPGWRSARSTATAPRALTSRGKSL